MGLSLWPKDESIASDSVTALRMPESVDGETVARGARARYGVTFSGGVNELAGRLIRIGHMGPTAEPMYAILALTALGGTLLADGCRVDVGVGIEAALKFVDDLAPA